MISFQHRPTDKWQNHRKASVKKFELSSLSHESSPTHKTRLITKELKLNISCWEYSSMEKLVRRVAINKKTLQIQHSTKVRFTTYIEKSISNTKTYPCQNYLLWRQNFDNFFSICYILKLHKKNSDEIYTYLCGTPLSTTWDNQRSERGGIFFVAAAIAQRIDQPRITCIKLIHLVIISSLLQCSPHKKLKTI